MREVAACILLESTQLKHPVRARAFPNPILWMATALCLLALAACAAVGPDYKEPETHLPPGWSAAVERGLVPAPPQPETLARWWTGFNDPVLTSLVQRAVAGNLDLQAARARVREARARRGISAAGFYPTLDAAASVTKARDSKSTKTSAQGDAFTLYSAGFDAAWEIDLFGAVRRSVEAAQADLEASQEDLGGVMVSLLAELALNYVDVRTYQSRIKVAEANAKAQEDTHELTRSLFEAGLTDSLAVQSARYDLASTRAQIPLLRTALEGALNRIAVLLGVTPGQLHAELASPGLFPVPPLSVAVGVPADTLRKRPDVRRAERLLASQTARIGVATADLYPRLQLLGSLGYEALSSDLITPGNLFWSLGPRLSWRLFSGGAIRRNIQAQSALQEQSLAHYEATVLSALEEAENAMTAYVNEQQRRDQLVTATEAASRAFQLARDQYQTGIVDFSEVLLAQRALLSFEDQLAQSSGTVSADLVRIYKALGGGWPAAELQQSAAPPPNSDGGRPGK